MGLVVVAKITTLVSMGLVVVIDVTPVPPVPISWGRTVVFVIVEYIIMEWTMPNEAEYAGYAGGCLS